MITHGDDIELSPEEASGGQKPHIVRYVLLFSLLLAIAGLSAVWILGTMGYV